MDVKEQLRLRFVIPLVAVALGGLGVAKFVLMDDGNAAEAAAPTGPAATSPAPAPAPPTATATDEAPEEEEGGSEQSEKPTGMEKLTAALAEDAIVIVVVYSPDGAVDAKQVSEARAAADDVATGFLSLNGLKERDVEEIAEAYDVRTTPHVLVFRRGPEVAARFDTWADRETLAQAAQIAREVP
jgi:hypothetical protein